MKKYRVTFEELDKNTKYHLPECIKDIVQKQINKVNRNKYISRTELERRSLTSQEIYYTLSKLPKKEIIKLENDIQKDRTLKDYNYTTVKKTFKRIFKKYACSFGILDFRLNEAVSLVMSYKFY